MLENTLVVSGIDRTIGYTSKARLVAGVNGRWCCLQNVAGAGG